MTKDEYAKKYLEVVDHPEFKVFGLNKSDILRVRERMDVWAATDVFDVLKPIP